MNDKDLECKIQKNKAYSFGADDSTGFYTLVVWATNAKAARLKVRASCILPDDAFLDLFGKRREDLDKEQKDEIEKIYERRSI